MGFYIETPRPFQKALQLIASEGAEVTRIERFEDVPEGKALICVAENRFFDAAGICYDAREFMEFRDPRDGRPKTWLLMDKERVIELCPPVKAAFEEGNYESRAR